MKRYMKPRVLSGNVKMTGEISAVITGPIEYNGDLIPILAQSWIDSHVRQEVEGRENFYCRVVL